jgi:hypothetical protein
MKNIRTLVSVAVLILLPLGYAASQWAALSGTAQEYAEKVDCPQVMWLALFLLVVCIVFAFIKEVEADEK